MRVGLKKLGSLGLALMGLYVFPRAQGLPLLVTRFLTYACTLRFNLDLYSLRALGLGQDLEDPEVIRAHFWMAAWVTFILALMNVGSVALMLRPPGPGLPDLLKLNFTPPRGLHVGP